MKKKFWRRRRSSEEEEEEEDCIEEEVILAIHRSKKRESHIYDTKYHPISDVNAISNTSYIIFQCPFGLCLQ